jgi:hypothetical protein
MKKFSILLVFLFSVISSFSETRDLKMIYRDYTLSDTDALSTRPISVGLVSWTDNDIDILPGLYVSIAVLTYKDIVRLEVGGVTTWDQKHAYLDSDMLIGISTLINDKFVVGIWMSPFWNLHPIYHNDPYGIMVGYAF